MVTAPPKLQQDKKPWDRYRNEASGPGPLRWELLVPGWGGYLDDEELSYIQRKLQADPALAFAWGYRPGQKTRSESSIRRVAMYGDPDCRATNIKLARSRSEPPQIIDDKAA
jgi:hypothetical protein